MTAITARRATRADSAAPMHRDGSSSDPELIDRYGGRIRRLALRLCSDANDADDLVQETFLQAHRKWSQFEGRSDPGTWLYTIAIRIWRRKFLRRRTRARRPAMLSSLMPWAEATIADLRHGANEGLDRQLADEAQAALRRAIAQMPPSFRLPLVLKDILELSLEDVGAVLDLKPQTVKTRVHRARLMLRKALVRGAPQRPAPAPVYERQLCLDLLAAKLDAMDHGRRFPVTREVVCERCLAVFAELDLTARVCASIDRGKLPPALRRALVTNTVSARSAGAAGREPRRTRSGS
ncbi:MAG: RNA polymerase sigma factor [Phycisphaerales bacterium]